MWLGGRCSGFSNDRWATLVLLFHLGYSTWQGRSRLGIKRICRQASAYCVSELDYMYMDFLRNGTSLIE